MESSTTSRSPGRLGECLKEFSHHASPRFLVALIFGLAIIRVQVGSWSPVDALVALALILTQPPSEWLIHVHLLHVEPTSRVRRFVYAMSARQHAAHHRSPERLELLFVPLATHLFAIGFWAAVLAVVLRSLPLAMTGGLTVASLTLVYEWMHFLPHTRFVPTSRLIRAPWRAHRLHHYKSEHYWYGICTTFADHLFGTYKSKEEVATSPTCRNLHGAFET